MPNSIFNSFPVKSDYELAEYQNNKQLLNVLVESINSSGNRVFISKGFDLGLFTYQIVIPGISEAEDILPSGKIRHSGGKSIYDDLRHINSDDALALAERCSILFSTGETTLAQLLDIEKYASYTNATTPVDGISASIFIALLYIRCHRWGRAAKYIHNIIEKLEQLNIPYNLLPSTSLTRQCFAENYLSRKFYSNGEHVICDVAPKSSREKNYSLDKLPEMCITCSDFPLCGGIKPCDSEKCAGRYKQKAETIAKVIAYTKKKLI